MCLKLKMHSLDCMQYVQARNANMQAPSVFSNDRKTLRFCTHAKTDESRLKHMHFNSTLSELQKKFCIVNKYFKGLVDSLVYFLKLNLNSTNTIARRNNLTNRT